MPLKVNVGLSRKVGEPSFGSRGANVNLEIELDQSLLNQPEQLQARIRQLFGMLRISLMQELQTGAAAESAAHLPSASGNGSPGKSPSNSRSSVRPATPSQAKALYAISRNQGIDLPRLLHERFQVTRADELTIAEASRLIDELKSNGAHQER